MLAPMQEPRLPLAFVPVYQGVVWGGRRMERWRTGLPPGPIGESWDIADHARGMSVVAHGPFAGQTLRQLVERWGRSLIGGNWTGGDFPLLVKLIDAQERLSVQVHPDDDLARSLGVGERGKTESWLLLEEGGELFVGTRPGTTRDSFAAALASGTVAQTLNRFTASAGDCFFLPARTVHALGRGCLVYEVQQTCDVTFRVDDWGRVGLDGKPRPLHRDQSLATIDFAAGCSGPVRSASLAHPAGGTVRRLVDCAYFSLEERIARLTAGGGDGSCAIVVCLEGHGDLATAAGSLALAPMQSVLVPACAGAWNTRAAGGGELKLLVAQPR